MVTDGTSGDDLLIGTAGPDYLSGGAGNDTLVGKGGSDTLIGGAGDADLAVFDGARAQYLVSVGPGALFVQRLGPDAASQTVELHGVELFRFGGGDVLTLDQLLAGNPSELGGQPVPQAGGGGPSALTGLPTGSEGADRLVLGDDGGSLLGLGGDDLLQGGKGNDRLFGNLGDDTLLGGAGQDTLYGGRGQDVLWGEEGRDLLFGNLGDDTLHAGTGGSTLYGGQGDDVLVGGPGDDVLSGDLGADRYVIGAGSGRDVILGYDPTEGDRLDLQGQSYTLGTGAEGWVQLTLSGGGTVEFAGVQARTVAASALGL